MLFLCLSIFALFLLADCSTKNTNDVSYNRRHIKVILDLHPIGNNFPLGTEAFKDCPVQRNCELITDKPRMNVSDAVVVKLPPMFRSINMIINDIANSDARKPDQYWVFVTHEPPTIFDHQHKPLDMLNNFFNLTMTYRMDSDIVTPYGWFERIENPVEGIKVSFLNEQKNKSPEPWSFEHKTRMVAWAVSHLNRPSGRDEYVKELQKYIPVDIYGKQEESLTLSNQRAVMKQELSRYKFYLAFENSICKDYVTEKAFRSLNDEVGAIPVVMGAADYARVLPPRSYIDVRDFSSPKELADHLYKVTSNKTLFDEYHLWRQTYQVKEQHSRVNHCALCALLHQLPRGARITRNISEWYGTEQSCITPQEYFQGTQGTYLK